MIHTFQLISPPLTFEQHNRIETHVFDLASRNRCKIVSHHERLLLFQLPTHPGFRLCLNGLNVPHLWIIVNPAVAFGGGYHDLCTLTPDLLDRCMEEVSSVLHETKINFSSERMILSRIDCTADIQFPYKNGLEAFISCVQRTNPAKGYHIERFDKRYSNYKEMNQHSFRMACNDVSLTIYDKGYQLVNEGLMREEEISSDRLRFEVALRNRAFQRLFTKYGGGIFLDGSNDGGNVKNIILGFSNLSLKILRDYFNQSMTPGQYLCRDLAAARIDNGPFSKKIKARMKELLVEVARCHKGGVSAALASLELRGHSQYELQYLLKCFQKIDLNPASINISTGYQSFPSIAELLGNEDILVKPLFGNESTTYESN